MSADAIRELRLKVTYDSRSADAASAKHHAAEQARIARTAAEQARADAAYERAIKAHLAAEKRLEAEKVRGIREAAREQERLHREMNRTLRQSERESFREREGLVRRMNALLKSSERDEVRLAREAAREKIRAEKETFKDWKAGMDARHRIAMKEFAEEQAATRDSNREVADLLKTYMGFQAVKGLASGIANEWRTIADDIGRSSEAWQKFRASLQGVASLEDKANTNKFAAAEVDRAERAHVTPEQAAQFREAFLAKASLYVTGPDAKMTEADANLYQEKLMEYAASKKVSMEEMAGFAGGLLAQRKGKATATEMLAEAGQTFGGLEASSASVAHLMPMQVRMMAQGFSSREAAAALAGAPQYAPEEEHTFILRAVDAFRDRIRKGEGAEFGLRKGMRPDEILRAGVKAIQDRAAKGEDLDDLIEKASHGEQIAGKAIRGMLEAGGVAYLDQWKRVVERAPADQINRSILRDRSSDAGRQRAVDSRAAIEEARMGLRNDAVNRRLQVADVELKAHGEYERFNLAQSLAGVIPFADDYKSRMRNLQAIRRARAELGETSGVADTAVSTSNLRTLELMTELLKRIEEQGKRQADALEKWLRANPAASVGAGVAPLVAAPLARGNGVR